MEGLLGLTKSVNSAESSMRDLSILQNMSNQVEGKRQQEVQAQQMEEAAKEHFYQMSDQLLEKDRNRINKRMLDSQKQLKEALHDYGGSRSEFQANGGLSVINNIKNGIMRSDEASRYKSNKENLARIFKAQVEGMAHLIAPSDLKSVEDYHNNEDGAAISYSGLMAEIELPPSEAFDIGEQIPMHNILGYKGNAFKILGNYKMAYPDRPEPNWKELADFAAQMGYGGVGTDRSKQQAKLEEQKLRAQYEKETKTDTNHSFVTKLNKIKMDIPEGLTIQDVDDKYGGSVIQSMKKDSKGVARLIGEKTNFSSRQRRLAEDGFKFSDLIFQKGSGKPGEGPSIADNMFNDKLGLRDAYEILPYNHPEIAERVFKSHTYENGKLLEFSPDEQMYRFDGVQLKGDNKLDKERHTGAYDFAGITTALKSKVTNGKNGNEENVLIVDAYNDDGSINKKSTSTINEDYKSPLELTTVIAMRNANGDMFYKEIDLSDQQIATVVSNALGDDDKLTSKIAEEAQEMKVIENIAKNTAEEQLIFKSSIPQLNKEAFSEPVFKTEGRQYFGANGGGQLNRYNMMKALYTSYDFLKNANIRTEASPNGYVGVDPDSIKQAMDMNIFSQIVDAGGITKDLSNYKQGNSEKGMIQKWLKNANDGEEEGSFNRRFNNQLASKWMQMLGLFDE